MPHIINREDAQNFVDSNPTEAEIDLLAKDELLVLAHFLEITTTDSSTKAIVSDSVKVTLFGESTEHGGTEGGEDGAGEVPYGTTQEGKASLRPLPGSLPAGYTVEQYLELARINSQARAMEAQTKARELELATQARAIEAQTKARELELAHEYRMAQLNQANTNETTPSPPQGLTMTGVIPPFTGDRVEDFFVMFEEVAVGMGWARAQWPFMLQTVLTGKARTTYVSVGSEVRQDYAQLKLAIIKAYQLRTEAYHQSFRKTHKKSEETHVAFARSMTKTFDQWLTSKTVTDFAGLRDLVLVENFLWKIDSQVAYHLKGKKVDCLTDAANLADDYVLTCAFRGKKPYDNSGNKFSKNDKSNSNTNFNKPSSPKPGSSSTVDATPGTARARAVTPNPGNQGKGNVSQKVCTYCGKHGHLASNCWIKARDERQGKIKNPVAVVNETQQSRDDTVAWVNQRAEAPRSVDCSPKCGVSPDSYRPFISSGSVRMDGCVLKVKILRDTGASRTLMLNPSPEVRPSGDHVVLRGAGGPFSVPLIDVEIECDLYKGKACVGLAEELPVPGVDLLLGNDLAGERVKSDPILSIDPVFEPLTCELEKEIPEAFPVCAVTRSMAKVAKPPVHDNPPIAPPPFVTEGTKDENVVNDSITVPEIDLGLAGTFMADLNNPDPSDLPSNCPSGLIELQREDEDCKKLAAGAVSEDEITNEVGVCYYIKNDILWRRWRPSDRQIDDGLWDVHQVVVPKLCRKTILQISYDIPVAGDLGVSKALDRIRQHFLLATYES